MKLNYKSIISIITIIIMGLITPITAVAKSESEELRQVDKDEKAMLDMFNKECAKTNSDNNSTKTKK